MSSKNTDCFKYIMNVTDLSKDNTYRDLWTKFKLEIIDSNDKLNDNYIDLEPRSFASFPALIKDNRIICFSGLQLDPAWGNDIARCNTKMWVHPDYRFKSIVRFAGGPQYLNTTHCLPLQLQEAKKLGIDCLFISRQKNKLGFEQYLNLIDINCNYKFELETATYNIFFKEQYVARCNLTDKGSDAWEQNMTKYKVQ